MDWSHTIPATTSSVLRGRCDRVWPVQHTITMHHNTESVSSSYPHGDRPKAVMHKVNGIALFTLS